MGIRDIPDMERRSRKIQTAKPLAMRGRAAVADALAAFVIAKAYTAGQLREAIHVADGHPFGEQAAIMVGHLAEELLDEFERATGVDLVAAVTEVV